MRTRRSLTLVTAAALLAVVSEWIAHGPTDEVSLRVADGVVGFVILCAAATAWQRRPANPIGVIMAAAGLAWFAGGLATGLAHLHRGPLVHLHISYPTGRLRRWPAALTVAAAYVVAIVEPLGRNDGVTIALSAVVAVVAVGQFLRTTGSARRAGVPALFAALAFAGVLGVAAFGRHAEWQLDTELLWAYYGAVAVAVTVLLVDFLRARWSDAVVTNLVIDLGQQRGTGTLRAALGRALGDPDLVLAYRLDDDRYVDDAGRAVDVSRPGPGMVATEITHDGAPLAVLLHDSAVLDDPTLVDAVAAGAGLAVSNARMQAEARERLDGLAASRRRIIAAGDTQRRQFGLELQDTIQHRLADLAATVCALRDRAELPAELIDEVARDLDDTRAELDDVAQGLHPRALANGRSRPLRSTTSPYASTHPSTSPSRQQTFRPQSRQRCTTSAPRRSPTSPSTRRRHGHRSR